MPKRKSGELCQRTLQELLRIDQFRFRDFQVIGGPGRPNTDGAVATQPGVNGPPFEQDGVQRERRWNSGSDCDCGYALEAQTFGRPSMTVDLIRSQFSPSLSFR